MQQFNTSFEKKRILVTGGANGIGLSIVRYLASMGGRVLIADFDNAGEKLAEDFKRNGQVVHFIRCDVTNEEDMNKAVEYAVSDWNGLDILINNAGIFPRASLLEMEESLWESVLNVNLKGTFLACKAAVPSMMSGGGAIINIGSLHSFQGQEDTVAYAASKGGMVTLTKNLAHSLSKHKIRVNCVHPGWVASDGEKQRWLRMGYDSPPVDPEKIMPLGRMQTGEDIAYAVGFLASDLASQITGQMLTVDGGLSCR